MVYKGTSRIKQKQQQQTKQTNKQTEKQASKQTNKQTDPALSKSRTHNGLKRTLT